MEAVDGSNSVSNVTERTSSWLPAQTDALYQRQALRCWMQRSAPRRFVCRRQENQHDALSAQLEARSGDMGVRNGISGAFGTSQRTGCSMRRNLDAAGPASGLFGFLPLAGNPKRSAIF